MKFCVWMWQKLDQKAKSQLTETAQKKFHLLEQFAKLKESNCMNIIILENTIQEIETSTCGQFLYENLFDPDNKSNIISHKKFTKQTLETLIMKFF